MFVSTPTQVTNQPKEDDKAKSKDDSDSDWEDDDFEAQKFNIKIKPIAQVSPSKLSASVDELRASVGTWKSMANINLVKPNSRRHHQSTAQLNENMNIGQVPVPTKGEVALDNEVDRNLNYISNDLRGVSDLANITLTDTTITLEPNKPSANVLNPIDIINQNELNMLRGPAEIIVPRPTSSAILAPVDISLWKGRAVERIPVAFVVQESLNVRAKISTEGTSLTNLVGRLKLAMPLDVLNGVMSPEDLVFSLITTVPWNRVDLNYTFINDTNNATDTVRHFTSESLNKRLSVKMKAIKEYARSSERVSQKSYFLTPELLKYTIRSQDFHDETILNPKHRLNPVEATSHWLCDNNRTKVRIDLKIMENVLQNRSFSMRDIKDLKISLRINGQVSSFQSKPVAKFVEAESQLVWFFPNMESLFEASGTNGVASCLAQFVMTGDLSTPCETMLQFSISGKTLSGTRVILDDSASFKMVRQKFDVKTGVFVCEPKI